MMKGDALVWVNLYWSLRTIPAASTSGAVGMAGSDGPLVAKDM